MLWYNLMSPAITPMTYNLGLLSTTEGIRYLLKILSGGFIHQAPLRSASLLPRMKVFGSWVHHTGDVGMRY